MIYFDHASSTYIAKDVIKEITESMQLIANPSSKHFLGRTTRDLLEAHRKNIAKLINVNANNLIFTSSSTMADNIAVSGVLEKRKTFNKKANIVGSKLDHPSVANSCKANAKKYGIEYREINIEQSGKLSKESIKENIDSNTVLATVPLYAGLTGIKQDLKAIVDVKPSKCHLHVDAALLKWSKPSLPRGVDTISFNPSKIHGPKGIGILVAADISCLSPIIYGGNQEQGIFPGTENISAIAGVDITYASWCGNISKNLTRIISLSNYLNKKLNLIEGITIVRSKHSPQIINIFIKGIDGFKLRQYLSANKVYVGSGAACSASNESPEPLFEAMGYSKQISQSNIRLSIDTSNTRSEIDSFIKELNLALKNTGI